MTKIFIVSDTHWGHRNMYNFIESDGRPVRITSEGKELSMEEGDQLMVDNWNKTVKPEDIVYHLGDVYFGSGYSHLYNLNGRKRLLLGNHDDGKDKHLQSVFQKIGLWRMFPEFNCVLSHIPLHESNMFKVKYNLHGHIHRKANVSPRHLNCSVEVQNYTPKPLEELLETIEHRI